MSKYNVKATKNGRTRKIGTAKTKKEAKEIIKKHKEKTKRYSKLIR